MATKRQNLRTAALNLVDLCVCVCVCVCVCLYMFKNDKNTPKNVLQN